MHIALIGLGCRFPQAADPLAYWDLISSGRTAFGPMPAARWNHANFFDASLRSNDKAYIDRGGYLDDEEIRNFAALHYGLAPRRIQVTDPQHRLLLDVVRCALQDAGYEKRAFARDRAGVFVGISLSEYKDVMMSRIRARLMAEGAFGATAEGAAALQLLEATVQDVVPVRAFHVAGTALNLAAATVSQQFDLGGPAFSMDSACSSALVAVHDAIVHLRAGMIDLAVAGGVYLNLVPDSLIGFSRIGALSRSGECRPFGAKADGFVMGEGVGAVILKRLEDAQRDGDRIYAVIRGTACNNDGRSEGPMTPRQGGQLQTLRSAYKDAGVPATSVGYIEAHGTATTVGDLVEVGALREAFVEQGWTSAMGAHTALGSVKANIGHTMSAAGAAGLIKAALVLHHRTLPPQPSVGEQNAKLGLAAEGGDAGPFFLADSARPWERREGQPRRAAVSGFGFGGTNVHLVLEEPPAAQRSAATSRAPAASSPVHAAQAASPKARAELFLLAGSRPSIVARHAERLLHALPRLEAGGTSLTDVAYTFSRRTHGDARLAVVADSYAQLTERLQTAAKALHARDTAPAAKAADDYSAPAAALPSALGPGLLFSQGPIAAADRKLALLFPGQGAQRVGLLAEAYAQVPAFRDALDALDDSLGPDLHARLGGTLRSFLYPALPAGDEIAQSRAQSALAETHVCQPAMAAVGLALFSVLEKLGVKADAVLGHSLGEFAAAAAAGVITPAECVQLVARRGLAMRDLKLADRGAMASAAASRSAVADVLASLDSRHAPEGAQPVVLANLNHPQQTVISGSTAGVAAARAALEARGVAVTPLDVSHAFHSPLMAPIAAAMTPLVAALPLQSPRTPVVSAIDVGLYPHDVDRVREIWVRHATAPVDFAAAVQAAAAPSPAGVGARIWLNVGAGPLLASFAKATLPERDRTATAGLAGREDDGLAALSSAVGLLWAAGLPIDTAPLFEGRQAALCLLPPTLLETQPYWAVERTGKPAAVALPAAAPLAASQPPVVPPFASPLAAGAASADGAGDPMASDSLVALFREQVALLQTHAKVLEQQAAALSGRGIPTPKLPAALSAAIAPVGTAPHAPAVRAPEPQAASREPQAGDRPPGSIRELPAPLTPTIDKSEVAKGIVASVARISAFPAEAVKLSQTLAGDLGFDSLMTVELDGDINKTFPGAGGLPRNLLGAGTTVQDLVDHIAQALQSTSAPSRPMASLGSALGALADAGPELLRFAPQAVPVPLKAGAAALPAVLVITRDALGVAEELQARLEALGTISAIVDLGAPFAGFEKVGSSKSVACGWPDADADALFARVAEQLGPVGGVLHLAGLSPGSQLSDLISAAAEGRLEGAQALSPHVLPLLWAHRFARAQAKAGDTVAGGLLVVATAQGGQLGLHGGGSFGAASLAGFAKALSRERPAEVVKAIDVDPTDGPRGIADAIVAELRSGNASAEVGYKRGVRSEADLGALPAAPPIVLGTSDVVLVTGGSRGVGARLATALARSGCGVIVTGRGPLDGKAEATLAAIAKAGGRAAYAAWDVTTGLTAALDAARKQLGPITALVHAAGVSDDSPAAQKDDEGVLRVLAPKIGGLAQALLATQRDPLRLAVLVSSWAGRFGNWGQTDYSAANAALSRLASLLTEGRPELKALALAYPPWEGTGMVSRIPALARQGLIAQGVPFIDDAAGERALLSALQAGAQGEVLLATQRPPRRTAHRTQLELHRGREVYLEDHQLAGQPVLPLASALDLVATAALEAAGASQDTTLTVRDFELKAPVRVAESLPLALTATGEARPGSELALSLIVQQPGSGARAFSRPASYVGFATVGGDVQGALSSAQPAPSPEAGALPQLPMSLAEFYAGYVFHGPRLQGIAAIEQISPTGIVGWVRTSRPADLVKNPERDRWTVDPLALDSALQLAAYWAWTYLKRAGFPTGIAEYVQRAPFGDGPLRVTLTLEQSQGDDVRGTVVIQAKDGRVVAIARGVEGEFKHRDPRFLKARGLGGAAEEESARPAPALSASAAPNAAVAASVGLKAASIDTQSSREASEPLPAPGAIDEATYRVEQFPEVQELEQRLGLAAAFGLKNPYFNVHERVTNDTSVIGGRTMINWSSYNYLGLSGDEHVSRAAQEAIERYGTSVSASRVASGEKPLHRQLEQELASFLGTEDSVVMVSGHAAFVTVIGHLFGPGDLILHDALAHDCIMGGAKLSGAKRRPFPHNDFAALEKQLAQLRPHYKRVLIAVEGVYSMDGDITPLPKFIELKKKYGCLLMVDEAHSIGVLGRTGRGVGEHFDVDRADVDLWMGTFSKSFASCGGYVGGSKVLIQYLKYTTPGFVYSVGMSPANAAAALEACKQIVQHPEKVKRLHERARLFLKVAKEKGLDTGMSEGSAVVPAIIGNSLHSLQVSESLRQRGINVQPIMYPAVEENAARLRFFVTATHTEQQIRETVQALAEEIAKAREEGAEQPTGSL